MGRGRMGERGGQRRESLPLEWDADDEEWGDSMLGDVDVGVEAGAKDTSYVVGDIAGKRGREGGKSATSLSPRCKAGVVHVNPMASSLSPTSPPGPTSLSPRGKAGRMGKGWFEKEAAGGGIKWEDEGWEDDLPAPPAEQKIQIKSERLLLDPDEKFDAGTYVDEDAVRGGRGGASGDEALKFSDKRAREFGGKGLLKKRGVRQWGVGGRRAGQKVSW